MPEFVWLGALAVWNWLLQALAHGLVVSLPLLLPALLMQWASRTLEREAVRTLGARAYLLLFGWLGTATHELGHALFHVLFGHRITRMKLFSLDPQSESLGYVRFEFNPGRLWHRLGLFFAGIGPILFGSACILMAARVLLPGGQLYPGPAPHEVLNELGGIPAWLQTLPSATWELATRLLHGIGSGTWRAPLFLWLAFSVGSSITLSTADLRLAARGACSLGILLLALHGLLRVARAPLDAWVGRVAQELALLPPLLLFVAGLNLLFLLLMLGAGRLLRVAR